MVREPDATMQPTPQDNQLMSKHRVLSLKPQLRLEWRCQHGQSDLFAEYVAEAERVGTEDYHLYEWTRATIDDPIKRAKYVESFSLYVDDQEVCAKETADARA